MVATKPVAGELVSTGQAIDVIYNPIKTPVPIPDVKGKTVERATASLTGAGFSGVTRHRVRRRFHDGAEHRD